MQNVQEILQLIRCDCHAIVVRGSLLEVELVVQYGFEHVSCTFDNGELDVAKRLLARLNERLTTYTPTYTCHSGRTKSLLK